MERSRNRPVPELGQGTQDLKKLAAIEEDEGFTEEFFVGGPSQQRAMVVGCSVLR